MEFISENLNGVLGGLSGVLGVGLVTVLGYVAIVRKIVKEGSEAVLKAQWFYRKYYRLFQSEAIQYDVVQVKKEIREFLFALAKLCDKVRLKGYATTLRKLI